MSGTGSCDLLAHVHDSGGPLRLFFTTNEGSASMGIEVGGVIERAAGVHFVLFIQALIMRTRMQGSKHTTDVFYISLTSVVASSFPVECSDW